MPKLKTLPPRIGTIKQEKIPKLKTWGTGRGGRSWRRIVEQVKQRDNYTCQKCGRIANDGMECDHIINMAQGGSDDLSNLQLLCHVCHAEKTKKETKGG